MARGDWMKERLFVLNSAADFMIRWGGSARDVAETAVRCHYRGKSPDRAVGLLARDVQREVDGRKRRAFERESQDLVAMARTLKREGWRWMTIPERRGGFFWHDQHGSVNNMGGGFASWEEAVQRTFNSVVRKVCGDMGVEA